MTRTIAIANQKGGVGKTTTSVNIACGWGRLNAGSRILLVDIDPQANATSVLLGMEAAAGPRQGNQPTIREVLREDVTADDALRQIQLEASSGYAAVTLDVLPAHLELAMIETELAVAFRGEHRLQQALTPLLHRYDLIIVDCPPSLGILTLNALIFCRDVVIPVDPGVFPLIGLNMLRRTIQQVRQSNPKLNIVGVLPTMSMNTVISRETIEQLETDFPGLLLPIIPRRVVIEEAHVSGIDVFGFAPNSDGADAYATVIKEIEQRG